MLKRRCKAILIKTLEKMKKIVSFLKEIVGPVYLICLAFYVVVYVGIEFRILLENSSSVGIFFKNLLIALVAYGSAFLFVRHCNWYVMLLRLFYLTVLASLKIFTFEPAIVEVALFENESFFELSPQHFLLLWNYLVGVSSALNYIVSFFF